MSETYFYRRHLFPSFACSRPILFVCYVRNGIIQTSTMYGAHYVLVVVGTDTFENIRCTAVSFNEWVRKKKRNEKRRKTLRFHSLEVNLVKTWEAKTSLECGMRHTCERSWKAKKEITSWIAKTDKIPNRKEEKSVIDPFYLSSSHNVIRNHSEFLRDEKAECCDASYVVRTYIGPVGQYS